MRRNKLVLTQNELEIYETESKGVKSFDHLENKTEGRAKKKTEIKKVFVLYFSVLFLLSYFSCCIFRIGFFCAVFFALYIFPFFLCCFFCVVFFRDVCVVS